jgi:hypothetical protein
MVNEATTDTCLAGYLLQVRRIAAAALGKVLRISPIGEIPRIVMRYGVDCRSLEGMGSRGRQPVVSTMVARLSRGTWRRR